MTSTNELENLILQIGNGDQDALSKLYNETGSQLFGYCNQTLGSRVQSEEALFDTYLAIWATAGSYQASGLDPIEWIFWTARQTPKFQSADKNEPDVIVPILPPRHIKLTIKKRLSEPAVATPTKKASPKAPKRKHSWFRFFLGAASALMIILAIGVATLPAPEPLPVATHSATLQTEGDDVFLALTYNVSSGAVHIEDKEEQPADGTELELWLIPSGAIIPVSLGVLPKDSATDFIVAEQIRSQLDGGILAITARAGSDDVESGGLSEMIAAGPVVTE
ncbi:MULTISPECIES: anti-sigma factor domain-containing protein [Halocynthiibacter]|uniref:Anti-sigma factor n=1 Tax=Halocynthiibacter halioticoli TaxID=2986804 RepID=A0AAE3LQ34_9RHOB|nr:MULTISPECIES: anti-sigma factor [Halocynthiibacter]MCV6823094.1 anti-sigma factor [Halocynthiibacter halioticoli]MCW4056095.1 anti-sigma factor [Halocynthiibacter sp. SDUM655004]